MYYGDEYDRKKDLEVVNHALLNGLSIRHVRDYVIMPRSCSCSPPFPFSVRSFVTCQIKVLAIHTDVSYALARSRCLINQVWLTIKHLKCASSQDRWCSRNLFVRAYFVATALRSIYSELSAVFQRPRTCILLADHITWYTWFTSQKRMDANLHRSRLALKVQRQMWRMPKLTICAFHLMLFVQSGLIRYHVLKRPEACAFIATIHWETLTGNERCSWGREECYSTCIWCLIYLIKLVVTQRWVYRRDRHGQLQEHIPITFRQSLQKIKQASSRPISSSNDAWLFNALCTQDRKGILPRKLNGNNDLPAISCGSPNLRKGVLTFTILSVLGLANSSCRVIPHYAECTDLYYIFCLP